MKFLTYTPHIFDCYSNENALIKCFILQIYFSLISIIFVYHLKYPQEQSILEPDGISDSK